jgi:hypothetical protein
MGGLPCIQSALMQKIALFSHDLQILTMGQFEDERLHLENEWLQLKGTDFTACGKTQPKWLCNKGTALAGPIRSAE